MNKGRLGIAFLWLALALSGQTLKKIAAIDLPDPKGERFDYLVHGPRRSLILLPPISAPAF